jgi:hypothetical protein
LIIIRQHICCCDFAATAYVLAEILLIL